MDTKDRVLQPSQEICVDCIYEEDIDEESGLVTSDWIQCTNVECAVWSHVDCLEQSDGDYVCIVCHTLFVTILGCVIFHII